MQNLSADTALNTDKREQSFSIGESPPSASLQRLTTLQTISSPHINDLFHNTGHSAVLSDVHSNRYPNLLLVSCHHSQLELTHKSVFFLLQRCHQHQEILQKYFSVCNRSYTFHDGLSRPQRTRLLSSLSISLAAFKAGRSLPAASAPSFNPLQSLQTPAEEPSEPSCGLLQPSSPEPSRLRSTKVAE